MASRSPSSSPDSASGSGNVTDPARPDTGEPLGSDSDSDGDLGQFYCGGANSGVRLDGTELENAFETAAERLQDLVQTASREQLLYLYARYKQVTRNHNIEYCVNYDVLFCKLFEQVDRCPMIFVHVVFVGMPPASKSRVP